MNRCAGSRVRGFTLLEVLIALAIMAGVVTTVITVFNRHLSLVSRDKEETVALLLARSKLDEPGFRDLQSGSKGTFAPQWPLIAWETAIVPTELPGVSRLILTITWDGTGRKLSLVQYVAKL